MRTATPGAVRIPKPAPYPYQTPAAENIGPWESALPRRLHGALRKMPTGVTPAGAEALLDPVVTVDVDFRTARASSECWGSTSPRPGFAALTGPLTDVHLIREVALRLVRRPPGVLFSGGAEHAAGDGWARRNLVDPELVEVGEELAVARARPGRANRLRGAADRDVAGLAGQG